MTQGTRLNIMMDDNKSAVGLASPLPVQSVSDGVSLASCYTTYRRYQALTHGQLRK